MTRLLNPRLSIEMALYAKPAGGAWAHEAGPERAFGFCGETSDPTKYEHWWLMSSGLIRPDSLSATRKIMIKPLDDPAYGPLGPGSTTSGWIAQQRANWAALKNQDPARPLGWIHANVWTFDAKPSLAASGKIRSSSLRKRW